MLQALRSTSAFALPKAELARVGITVVPADDPRAGRANVRYVLAGAEINQAIWVLHGKGDAGAFNEGDWAALPETRPLAAPRLPRDAAHRPGPRCPSEPASPRG